MASTLPPACAMRAKMAATCAAFCLRQNHLGHAGAQGAVMVDLGEADVFKGQVSQAIERIGNAGVAFANFVEQRFNAAGDPSTFLLFSPRRRLAANACMASCITCLSGTEWAARAGGNLRIPAMHWRPRRKASAQF